jgi:hypothetical protein
MNAAIGKLLTQFDASGRAAPAEQPKLLESARPKAPETARPKEIRREPPPPPPSPAPRAEPPPVNLLDDAYHRGYAAGLADGEAKLAEERIRGAVRLGEERAKWSDQQSVAMVNGFASACRELENGVAASVARILQGFVLDKVREAAVAALVQQIATLTTNSPVPLFRISGPGDLLDQLRSQLEASGRTGVEYHVADTAEIRVVADQTVIETQLSVWTARLRNGFW